MDDFILFSRSKVREGATRTLVDDKQTMNEMNIIQ